CRDRPTRPGPARPGAADPARHPPPRRPRRRAAGRAGLRARRQPGRPGPAVRTRRARRVGRGVLQRLRGGADVKAADPEPRIDEAAVEALQNALAAEHAAVWCYTFAGAFLSDADLARAREDEGAHRS